MEGWGAEPGSCAAIGGGGGRVVGEEGANPKPRLGRDWARREEGYPSLGREGTGRRKERGGALNETAREGGANSTPQPTACPNLRRAVASTRPGPAFLPALLGVLGLLAPLPASRGLCRPASLLFVVCVRVRSPFPVSPALVILPGFSVRDVRAWPRAQTYPKRDGGAGVPRRWVGLGDWRAPQNVGRCDSGDRFGSTFWA